MPNVWEYREPAEHGHPQTQAAAAAPQAYSQDEHLRRFRGPQVDAPRQQPLGPHLPGYEQTGQLYAPPPQYAPPRNVSWVSAHKGLTAVLSVCALTVTGAGVFALLPSGPGSPGPSAAAIAGVTASSRAPVQQAGVTAGAAPAAGITVTGTATAGAAVKVTAVPRATAPSAKAGPSVHPTATGSGAAPAVTASTPVVNATTPHTTPTSPTAPAVPPSSPPVTPTPPPPTCTVTGSTADIEVTVTQAEAGPNALDINIYEYGTDELAGKATLRVPGPVTAGETVSVTAGPNTLMTSCAVAGVVVTS
jgi:hypothetical protein